MDEQHNVAVDVILQKIQAVARAKTGDSAGMSRPMSPATTGNGHPPQALGPEGSAPVTLGQLLALRDEEFIHVAFRHILKRQPDPGGLAYYLSLLRSGSLTKLEILVAMRFSDEGRQAGVVIPGLDRSYRTTRAARLPIVGYLLRMIYGLLRLPVLMKNLETQDAYTAYQFAAFRHQLEELGGPFEDKAESHPFDERAKRVSRGFEELIDRQASVIQRAAANTVELQQHVARLEFAKANRKELATLDEGLTSALSSKADRQEVVSLALQIETKANRQDLASLSEQLQRKAAGLVERERQELAALASQVEAKAEKQELAALAGQVEVMGSTKADQQQLDAIESRIAQCENTRTDPKQIATFGDNLQTVTHQLAVCRQDLQDQHRRLGLFLELARKRMPEAFTAEQVTKMLSEETHFLDSLYVALEDRFRGNREAARESLKVYLTYLNKTARKGSKNLPLLDLACGRGEWLELLNTHGHPAKGVDVNRVALQQCKELGLDVVEEDAVDFLRKQPKDAFSTVTCFHYLEHIDFRSLVALLDESLRVLMPGGSAIFETPNPRNILVSTGDFYRDPTRRNPVFPDTLESVAELRGFAESTVYWFNDTRTELIPMAKFAFDDLNSYVNISRDVAWIGVKPL